MAEDRFWHLVSYDIRDPKRWRKVYRLLRGYGDHLQYSVFRVRGTRAQIARMRWELERILEQEDDLLLIPLCRPCAESVHARNPEEAWPLDDPAYKILGGSGGSST